MSIFKKQKGAAMVITAVMLPVVLAFTGIAVDIGRLYVEKAKLQNLADAAAASALVEMRKTKIYYPGTGVLKYKYKEGTGTLTTTIPIGALSDNSTTVEEIRNAVNTAAYDYLAKNYHLGTFEDNKSKVETEFYTLKNSDPAVDTDDAKYYDYRYYYEVVLSKRFPVYFARIIHPKDVLVRAGAVSMIDIIEPTEKMKYAEALKVWGKLSLEELKKIPPAERLDMDLVALSALVGGMIGKDLDDTKKKLNLNSSNPSNYLLGHYKEGTNPDNNDSVSSSYSAKNNTNDIVMNWLQGDYDSNKAFEGEATQQRYLFSDYATTHENGIKLWFTTSPNPDPNQSGKRIITDVTVKINPLDAANGSGPLVVHASYNIDNSTISW